jgi:hypothetical protein
MKEALNLFIWRCATELLFMPLVILHHLLNVSAQLANKRGFKQKKFYDTWFLFHKK